MRKKSAKRAPWITLGALVFVFTIIALIFQFMRKNNSRIIEQNKRYLEDAAAQSIKTMNELLVNSMGNVTMFARLYEQMSRMNARRSEVEALLDKTIFDITRIVDSRGTAHARDGGLIDVSDRDYFKRGMSGESGSLFIQQSRFTGARALAFFAPIHSDGGGVSGVLLGLYDDAHLSNLMSTSYFGQQGSEYLCAKDGSVVASGGSRYPLNIFDHLKTLGILSREALDDLRGAFAEGTSRSALYGEGASTGCIYATPLAINDWILVKSFPPSASAAMTKTANSDAVTLQIELCVLFALFVLLAGFHYIRQNRKLREKSESYGQIVDSVKELYARFLVIDLENDTYDYLLEGIAASLGIPKRGSYSQWLLDFPKKHFTAQDAKKFESDFSIWNIQGKLTKTNRFVQYEYEFGEQRWEKASLIKLDADSDSAWKILVAVEDVRALKKEAAKKQSALEAAFREAKVANAAKSDFLSRMSHDIRTPMNAIVGLTAIAVSKIDDRARVSDCLAKITSASRHLLSLINEVMDMSKIESGKFCLNEVEFNFSELLDEVMEIIKPSADEKNQNLNIRADGITREDVIGDSLRVQQIFVNLLSNAVKYTREGGDISVTVKEIESPSPALARYEIIIQDNGIGMSEEFLTRLYVPFERAEDARISKTQGTGLGMTIVQSIVRAMGGTIDVESALGKGTKFTVTISLKLQDKSQGADGALDGLSLLVVDDDSVSLESECIMARELGMVATGASSGKEAERAIEKAKAQGETFLAAIVDWKMPGMDAIETARAIRSECSSDIPIIIASSYDWSEIEEEARSLGIDTFISKPIFKAKLRDALCEISSGKNKVETKVQLDSLKSFDCSDKRALLVEDNELNREIAREILGMTRLQIECAENGREALEKFTESAPGFYDVIFMDIQMPVMNGYDAAIAIRALDRADAKTVPIVAMTANAFGEDVRAAMNAGMTRHLAKPLDIDKLAKTIKEILL